MAEDKKFVWSKEHPEGVLEDLTEEEKKQREKDKSEMLSEFDQAMLYFRETRDSLLAETDWVVIKEKEEGGSVSTLQSGKHIDKN